MNRAPIALFTYNRPWHTQKTVAALLQNKLAGETDLYVFSDAAKSDAASDEVDEVREFVGQIQGFNSVNVICHKQNKGLANSIIEGVTEVFKNHDSVIVLEDDLETSPYFLSFMNDALTHYTPEEIWSIGGYSPKISIPSTYSKNTYLAHRNCSWGWATWKTNWEKTDWHVPDFRSFFAKKQRRHCFERGGNDLSIMLLKQQQNKINSWSIRFNYAGYKNNLPSVYPIKSLVKNIGVDGSGTNMKKSLKYKTGLMENEVEPENFCASNDFDAEIEKSFKSFYNTSLYRRCINYFKTIAALLKKDAI